MQARQGRRTILAFGATLVLLAAVFISSPARSAEVNGFAFAVTPAAGSSLTTVTTVTGEGACYGTSGRGGAQEIPGTLYTCQNDVSAYTPTSAGLKLRIAGPVPSSRPPVNPNGYQGSCTSASPAIGDVTIVSNSPTALVVTATGAIPAGTPPGRYMICADPDPATLWNYYTQL